MVEVSGDDLERQREILESTILPDWAQRCGKDCAETWNETIGAALGMSIDADKL